MNGFIKLDLGNNNNGHKRTPFAHQMEAFDALNKTFPVRVSGYKGSLLVLPTAGGKTFTATNWICRLILHHNIKVLWLAQSSYLLDQATKSFIQESSNILHTRKTLNIRTVSSNTSHANSGSIELSDDIVIVTTQTAISDALNETTGFKGERQTFKLRQWIENCAESELFVVLDEAHHAPAYGCRTLLTEIRKIIDNIYILGLTATPTHNDQRIRGWLDKIFDRGICYQADINDLYKNNVLARPKYINKPTGRDMDVDDKLYDRIVTQHKDLPENIIEILANDSARNNYIVSDYINNKMEYGKTLIFADRWVQCEYIVEKLRENGVRADCVYSMSSGKKVPSIDGVGRRDNKQNELALKEFRAGNLDVLVNVKMLTEGVDVPDIKTVMITRNTTSGILFTQMIGRALRGKKAGGGEDKDTANIVMFVDNWKRLLPFANISDTTGDSEDVPKVKRGVPPLEWVSILLVKRACKDIEFIGKENLPCKYYMPIGWYETEYVVSIENDDGEEMLTASDSNMVYETNNGSFKRLIDFLIEYDLPEFFASERISSEKIIGDIIPQINNIFNFEEDDVDGNLKRSIINITRHIAQNGTIPEFIPFEIRDQYDIDRLPEKHAMLNSPQRMAQLRSDYEDSRLLWSKLYKKLEMFIQAYNDAEWRKYCNSEPEPISEEEIIEDNRRSTEDYRLALLSRDNKKCRCCGRELGKGIKLEIDHIVPVKMGGQTTLENLQILCKTCNMEKGVQLISFLNNKTQVVEPMSFKLIRSNSSESVECSVTRIINFFYRANAVCSIRYNQRSSGRYYSKWLIQLHEGNPINWLQLQAYRKDLLKYIQDELGWRHVYDIEIATI